MVPMESEDVKPEAESVAIRPTREGPPGKRIYSSEAAQRKVLTPWNVPHMALVVLAAIAVIFALQWAEKFFIPLLLGILIAYTLNPIVVWLERKRIPRVLGI